MSRGGILITEKIPVELTDFSATLITYFSRHNKSMQQHPFRLLWLHARLLWLHARLLWLRLRHAITADQFRPIEAVHFTDQLRPIEAVHLTDQLRPIEAVHLTDQFRPIEAVYLTNLFLR